MKLGIIYLVTGYYSRLWSAFYSSCEAYFCFDIEKGYEVFTDSAELCELDIPNVSWHIIEDKGWTINVSSKSEFVCTIREYLSSTYDYLFYLNGNLHFLKPISISEILPDAASGYFTVLSFDHYLHQYPDKFDYERNKESEAYIPYGQGKRYYQGGFYGGRTKEFLEYSEWSRLAIRRDLEKEIIACHHDESYLNRYLVGSTPRIINDKYGYCSDSSYRGEYKAEFLDKDALLGTDILYARSLVPAGLIWLQGDLGDQMFGLAFCYYLQDRNPERHFYPSYHLHPEGGESYIWNIFPLNISVDNAKTLERQVLELPIEDKQLFKEGQETQFHDSEDDGVLLNIYLGKWQCWHYVSDCAERIKRTFTFSHHQLGEADQKRLTEIHQSSNSVSVHICSFNEREQWLSGGICTSEYYEDAMAKIRELLGEEPEFFFFREDELGTTNEEQWKTMFLISQCKHHIIANSSISWWGAWLGNYEDKVVIAPERWNNMNAASELYPDTWLKLPVPMNKKWLTELCSQFILKDSFKKELGLYNGKMGNVLLFFHCARWLDNLWFEEYAEELLDEIYSDVTLETSLNFFNGLCGIGWGIEYLVQHGFVKGCTDEALTDLDKMVMKTDPRRIEDTSYETGIKGIVCYVNSRLSSLRSVDATLPFDSLYLEDLKDACIRLGVDMECNLELSDLLEQVSCYYSGKSKSEMDWYLVLKQLYV